MARTRRWHAARRSRRTTAASLRSAGFRTWRRPAIPSEGGNVPEIIGERGWSTRSRVSIGVDRTFSRAVCLLSTDIRVNYGAASRIVEPGGESAAASRGGRPSAALAVGCGSPGGSADRPAEIRAVAAQMLQRLPAITRNVAASRMCAVSIYVTRVFWTTVSLVLPPRWAQNDGSFECWPSVIGGHPVHRFAQASFAGFFRGVRSGTVKECFSPPIV